MRSLDPRQAALSMDADRGLRRGLVIHLGPSLLASHVGSLFPIVHAAWDHHGAANLLDCAQHELARRERARDPHASALREAWKDIVDARKRRAGQRDKWTQKHAANQATPSPRPYPPEPDPPTELARFFTLYVLARLARRTQMQDALTDLASALGIAQGERDAIVATVRAWSAAQQRLLEAAGRIWLLPMSIPETEPPLKPDEVPVLWADRWLEALLKRRRSNEATAKGGVGTVRQLLSALVGPFDRGSSTAYGSIADEGHPLASARSLDSRLQGREGAPNGLPNVLEALFRRGAPHHAVRVRGLTEKRSISSFPFERFVWAWLRARPPSEPQRSLYDWLTLLVEDLDILDTQSQKYLHPTSFPRNLEPAQQYLARLREAEELASFMFPVYGSREGGRWLARAWTPELRSKTKNARFATKVLSDGDADEVFWTGPLRVAAAFTHVIESQVLETAAQAALPSFRLWAGRADEAGSESPPPQPLGYKRCVVGTASALVTADPRACIVAHSNDDPVCTGHLRLAYDPLRLIEPAPLAAPAITRSRASVARRVARVRSHDPMRWTLARLYDELVACLLDPDSWAGQQQGGVEARMADLLGGRAVRLEQPSHAPVIQATDAWVRDLRARHDEWLKGVARAERGLRYPGVPETQLAETLAREAFLASLAKG